MWTKFKEFIAWLWGKIKLGGKWVLAGVIALALIVAGIFSLDKNTSKQNSNSDARPEVAQVYEPSIGTPLPPDTTGGQSEVSGAVTTEPSTIQTTPTQEETNTTNSQQVTYIAPNTGVDDTKPFVYTNQQLGFTVMLDGGTQVEEQLEGVKFTSKTGTLLFYVVTSKNNSETQDSIINQLSASNMTNQISKSNFLSYPSVSYLQNNQKALVVLTTNKIYYIVGEQKYFKNISL